MRGSRRPVGSLELGGARGATWLPARVRHHGKGIAHLLAGNIVFMASQALAVAVLVRMDSLRAAGVFVLGATLFSPIVILASLRLRQAHVADVAAGYGPYDYLRLRRRCAAVTLVVLLGLAATWPVEDGDRTILLAVAVAKIAETLSDFRYGVMQRAERFGRYGFALGGRGVLGVAVLTAALAAGWSATTAVIAWAGAWVAWSALADRSLGASTQLRPPGRPLRPLFRQLVPAGLSAGLVVATLSVPRLVVERSLGVAALGAFGAIYMVYTAAVFAVETSSEVALAPLSRALHHGHSTTVLRLLRLAAVVGVAVSMVGLAATKLVGEQALDVVFGPSVARLGADVLAILALALGAQVLTGATRVVTIAAGHFRDRALLETATFVLTIVLAVLLVDAFGLRGAAWAVVAASTTEAAASAWLATRRLGAPLAGAAPGAHAEGVIGLREDGSR